MNISMPLNPLKESSDNFIYIIVFAAVISFVTMIYSVATEPYVFLLIGFSLFAFLIMALFAPLLPFFIPLIFVYVFHSWFVVTFLAGQRLTMVGMIKDILFIALVVTWLIRALNGQYPIPWRSFFIIIFFLIWNVVHALLADYPNFYAAFYDMRLNIQFVFLLPILESIISSTSKAKVFVQWLFFIAVLFSAITLCQALLLKTTLIHYHRLTGLTGIKSSANVFGVYIAGFTAMGIGFFDIPRSRTPRGLVFWGIAICLLYVIASYSRRSFLGLGCSMLVLFTMFCDKRYFNRIKYNIILFSVILVGLFFFLNKSIVESVLWRFGDISLHGRGFPTRLDEWANALSALSYFDYVMGKGLATFGSASVLFDIPGGSPAHNYYVQLLVELGIVGLILYLTILYYVIYCGIRTYRRTANRDIKSIIRGCIAAIVVFLVAGLAGTSNVSIPVSILLWCFAGIVMAMSRLNRNAGTARSQERTLCAKLSLGRR